MPIMHNAHRTGLPPLVVESKHGIGEVILACFGSSRFKSMVQRLDGGVLPYSGVDNDFPSILHCQHMVLCLGG